MTRFVNGIRNIGLGLAIAITTSTAAPAMQMEFTPSIPNGMIARPGIVLAQGSGPVCHRCTAQCRVCGMDSRCNDTCIRNGNGMVQAGPGNCSNWFASAGCKQSR